ncbi:MAG: ACT domain-containing protein, partial [Xenococcaceae cyanobacterium]
MVNLTPNPSYSLKIQIEIPNRPGTLAAVINVIASVGGSLGEIFLLEKTLKITKRELIIDASSTEQAEKIINAIEALPEVTIDKVIDRTFALHQGGKICI